MFRTIISVIIIMLSQTAFAKNAPDFNALRKIWGNFDSTRLSKIGENKYIFKAQKGRISVSRELFIISPQSPELMIWFFHGSGETKNGNNQSPEIIISKMELKELSSWYNALIVIVDSGKSLYAYNPDNKLSEVYIYCGIYDKIVKLYGSPPAIFTGIFSGSEAAIKFAPFVKKLNSIVCISGIYDYDLLPSDSEEYKIRIIEYGSAEEWKLEQPVKILPSIECKIILLSEDKSIYRKQAETAAKINRVKKIKLITDTGKPTSGNNYFWASPEVMQILKREIQAAGGM